MSTEYSPGLAHLAYDIKMGYTALESLDKEESVIKTEEEPVEYSPSKLLVDINRLKSQNKARGKLKQGATNIQLSANQVKNLSNENGPMLNYPQLENELKRINAILTLISVDYTQVMNKVTEVVIQKVLNLASTNLDTASANFYTIFQNFKVTSLQKELTKESVVDYGGKNVAVQHTPTFIGGWNIVRLQSGVGANSMQNYWINDVSKSYQSKPAAVQPYGQEQVAKILDLCANLITFDWQLSNRLSKNPLFEAVTVAKNKLEAAFEKIKGQNSSEQVSKMVDLFNKADVLEKMLEFPSDVASMVRPAVETALRICEQSIIRMDLHHPGQDSGIAPELRTV